MKLKIEENTSTRVKKSLFGDVTKKIKTFAILTAENPMGKELSAADNNKNIEELKRLLKRMSIQYIPIEGHFGNNKEHSFLLVNLSLNDTKKLANTFKQLSFFYGVTKPVAINGDRHTASNITYYETNSINDEYEAKDTSEDIVNAKDFKDYYSRYGDFKFAINMDIFNEDLLEIVDLDKMEKGLNDEYTSFYRSRFRHQAYGGK